MQAVTFAIPGSIDLPTGGYGYDRQLLRLLPKHDINVRHLELPASFPEPSETDLARTAALVAQTPPDGILLIDGLAFGAMPQSLVAGFKRKIVALVHHPLYLETGIAEGRARELRELERNALSLANAVVATSRTTADILMRDFGVDIAKLTVAEPGTERAPRARGTNAPLTLLAVGSVVPRKGYDVLVEALRARAGVDWVLDLAGSFDLDPACTTALRRRIADAGFADRIRLLGAADSAQLATLYDRSDIFVMPSHYEGYGMVLTEALARGLAIVCTTGVPAADSVPGAALLRVEAGNADALAAALGQVMQDRTLRKQLQDAAFAAAQKLPTWDDTARQVAQSLQKVAA